MSDSILIIDRQQSKNGDIISFKESDDKIITTHFTGKNTDNFIIKKNDGKKLEFSFFKLNGIYYINLNGHHIIDYKKFVIIQQITRINSDVKLKNAFIGDIILQDCDIDIVHKALQVMDNWMKNKKSFFFDLLYHLFN